MALPTVFISYSHEDKKFARRLADDLSCLGLSVWKDSTSIGYGDSILAKIGLGLEAADYFLLCMSVAAMNSPWVKTEWNAARSMEIERGSPVFVPLRLERIALPPLLSNLKYIDFCGGYRRGFAELARMFMEKVFLSLRVGSSSGAGVRIMKIFLDKLRDRIGSFEYQETIDVSGEIVRLAVEDVVGRIDVGIAGAAPPRSCEAVLEWVKVFKDNNVLLVGRDDPMWGVVQISENTLIETLRSRPIFLGRPKNSETYKSVSQYLGQFLGIEEVEDLIGGRSVYRSDHVVSFVEEGRGMAILPSIVATRGVLEGKAWAIELPGDASRTWYGFWRKRAWHSTVAECLIQELKEGAELLQSGSA